MRAVTSLLALLAALALTSALPASRLVPPGAHSLSPAAPSGLASLSSPSACTIPDATNGGKYGELRLRGGKKEKSMAPPNEETSKAWKAFWRTAIISFLAGGLAGFVTDIMLWPIETVKTRLQTGEPHGIEFGKPVETLSGLFAGCHVALIFAPIFWALFFGSYEPIKDLMVEKLGKERQTLVYTVASGLALMVCFIVRVPVEIVKTRMMTGADSGFVECFKRILKHDGVLGLYTGFWSLAFRELPFTLIEMTLYEHMRTYWVSRSGKASDQALSGWDNCIIGSLADGSSGFVTNPFDVVKSRLMNMAGEDGDHGIFNIIAEVLKTKGAWGMMDGSVARTVWMGFGGFVFWPVLEWAQNYLDAKIE